MEVLSENTAVSVGLVLTIIGAVAWLTNMYWLSKNNAVRLDKVEQELSDVRLVHTQNAERLTRIESTSEQLIKKLDELMVYVTRQK